MGTHHLCVQSDFPASTGTDVVLHSKRQAARTKHAPCLLAAIGETDSKLVDMLVNMLVYMLLPNATQCMLVYVLAWKH
jgi:hypothetical protein